MWRINFFWFVVFLLVCKISGTALPFPQTTSYFSWQQPKHNRTELMCPSYCETNYLTESEQMTCCNCRSKPIWQCYPEWPHRGVDIEYHSRRGIGRAVYTDSNSHLNISKLFHTQEFLSSIPENICEFSDLVEIDLSWNRISVLENIKCLKRLDTLILKNNLITFLRNNTLHGMTELRFFDLSNNLLTTIEPYAISDSSIGILHISFKNNSLQNIDATNIILEHSFCLVDFSENDLKEVVNEAGWTANISKDYGHGGFVDFSHNYNLSFPNFEDLGIEDLTYLGKVGSFGFDFRNTNISCDCKIQPFLEKALEVIRKIWRDYFNLDCSRPSHLQGQSMFDLVKNNQMDKFICPINRREKCPKRCTCFHQPSRDRVVVNCSNTHQIALPDDLPMVRSGHKLFLDFSNNNITAFNTTKYLNDTKYLNLDNNDLSTIFEKSFTDATEIDDILLRNNDRLLHLPKTLQLLNPCNISFGDLNLKCSCDIHWIAKWVNNSKSKSCPGISNISCQREDGQILPSHLWTKENLQCPDDSWSAVVVAIVFGISSFIIGITALLLYHYQYEIYLLSRRDSKDHFSENEYFKFDIYISFNENNDELLSWVCNQLEPALNESGYSLCIPNRDFTPGSVKSDAILEHLHCSKKFLFLMDENFFNSDDASIWCFHEWRHSWNIFYLKKNRNIAVVNYDQLRVRDIEQRQIRAFFRLGLAIDFSNRKLMIFDEIYERLNLKKTSFEANRNIYHTKVIGLDPLRDSILDCRRCDTPKQKFNRNVVHKGSVQFHGISSDTVDLTRSNSSYQLNKTIDDRDILMNLEVVKLCSEPNHFTASQFFDTQEKKNRPAHVTDNSRRASLEDKYKPCQLLKGVKIHPYEPPRPRYKIPVPIFKAAEQ
ncbi:protein toll-like [Saccostrea cucullata]|uniref:protein toll-like n=1 Tax=Saccostrea cuccullata TaxID=36930 RepID=UPI002ED11E4F